MPGRFFTGEAPRDSCETPRPQAGVSRAHSGEQDASKGNVADIVSLDPVYPASVARDTSRSNLIFHDFGRDKDQQVLSLVHLGFALEQPAQ